MRVQPAPSTLSRTPAPASAMVGWAWRRRAAAAGVALWIGAALGCKAAEPPPAPPPPVQPVEPGSFDSCNVDADCTFGEIDHEILGSEDCPCLYGCPFTPLNKATLERRQSQYDRACDPSENGSGDSCGIDDCAPAPIPACVAGKCSAAR